MFWNPTIFLWHVRIFFSNFDILKKNPLIKGNFGPFLFKDLYIWIITCFVFVTKWQNIVTNINASVAYVLIEQNDYDMNSKRLNII
jgi:hypothetical protein